MLNELLLLTGLCGLTLILVRGHIFYRWRSLVTERFPPDTTLMGYAVNCCQCIGFWVGLLGAMAYRLSFGDCTGEQAAMIFLTGCSVSLFAVLADKYIFS